jgi:hypothetical protein
MLFLIQSPLCRPEDGRTRRDRVEHQNDAWSLMYPRLLEAHLEWACHGPPLIREDGPFHPEVRVLDLYGEFSPMRRLLRRLQLIFSAESRDIRFPLHAE